MKQLKYLGSYIGMTAGTALIVSLLVTALSFLKNGLMGYGILEWIGSYYVPYLLWAGLLSISVAMLSCFQVYAPMVLAMGCTRRRFLAGVLFAVLMDALLLDAVTVLFGRFGLENQRWMLAAAGLLGLILVIASIFLLFGGMVLVFGRKGIVVMMIFYGLIGALFGASFSMANIHLDQVSSMAALFGRIAEFWNWLFAAGCGMLILCSGLLWLVIRKFEVRS